MGVFMLVITISNDSMVPHLSNNSLGNGHH